MSFAGAPAGRGSCSGCLMTCLRCPSMDVLRRCTCREGQLQRVHHVLNECLVDRGASPNMVNLEAYIDGHHITTVQASSVCQHEAALLLT